MKITSPAFKENEEIPKKYSYSDENVSPPLTFDLVPDGTKSLALICHDPDAPIPGGFTHWVLWNIPADCKGIDEGQVVEGTKEGLTDWGKNTWGGPMPPSGTHHYEFYLYALDDILQIPANSNKTLLEKALGSHIIEKAKLTGLFTANK